MLKTIYNIDYKTNCIKKIRTTYITELVRIDDELEMVQRNKWPIGDYRSKPAAWDVLVGWIMITELAVLAIGYTRTSQTFQEVGSFTGDMHVEYDEQA